MKIVLVMFKEGDRRDFPLTDEKTTIGRRQDATLRIPVNDVSRAHCEVVLDKVGVRVRDLGSANGTYVNGKRVAESPLNAGDTLSVGPVDFMVQINGQPARITPHDVRRPEPPKKPEMAPATPAKKGEDLPPGLAPDDNEDSDVLDLGEIDFDALDDDDTTTRRR